ncbi:dihydroorotate dehydrogenase [Candidatus Neomarinimicrobiota bacterium]
MSTLSVALRDDLTLQNPILTASGTYGYGDEVSDLVDVNELGGLVTKSLTRHPRKGHPPPRIVETSAGMLNAIGLANIGVEKFCKEKLPYLSKLKTAVFISVAGASFQEYQEVIDLIESENPTIAGYEINISCPNVDQGGMEFGISAEITEELTRRLRTSTQRFILVKLSPNVTHIGEIALAAQNGGADGVSAINTVIGMGIDPLSGTFLLSNKFGGLSGPAIHPIALAQVYKIAQAVTIPIIGMGGIMTAVDVISFIRAGAWAVEVGTANYRDPGIGIRLAGEIADILEAQGISDLQKIRGSAHS